MSPVLKRAAGVAVVVVCLATLLALSKGRIAHEQCIAQPEDGTWINSDPATRSFPRAVLRFTCQDQVLNGQPYPPGPPWHIHLWGSCHPTNCDWGETGATRLSSGWICGTYDQGFAKRYVYARMSQARPGQLRTYVWTDFTDPRRADYASNDYYHR